MNLLSNAIKYNRPHGAVTITTEVQDQELVLSIRDEGLGLSAEQRASLFQPFNRLGAERTRVEGSGLGLVISKDLMRAMGGRLQVSSALGSGATFSMVLALSPSGSTDSGAGILPTQNQVEHHQVSQPKKVLYIEDEPVNAVLMHEIFRSHCNWHLQVATSGADGLKAASELRPDLVLIDMNLPDMHGLTLLRQLRSQPETGTLRCIALSADALPEQIRVAREAGFSDYWTKPIEVNSIMRLLHKHLSDPL
jgi:CheY-like chemotaxis protein